MIMFYESEEVMNEFRHRTYIKNRGIIKTGHRRYHSDQNLENFENDWRDFDEIDLAGLIWQK